MSSAVDMDRLVKDPRLLIELCREVIERIDIGSGDPNCAEKEAQLKEIAKTVGKLEKMGVPVPDALRGEKTRLAAQLVAQDQAERTLRHLADGLDDILKALHARLGRRSSLPERKQKPAKRSRAPKTHKDVLRKHIVKALRALGGRAKVPDVITQMGKQLEGKLLPGDMEWRESTSEYAWQNNAKWERYQMTQDGTLRSDSPRGYWELGEGQP